MFFKAERVCESRWSGLLQKCHVEHRLDWTVVVVVIFMAALIGIMVYRRARRRVAPTSLASALREQPLALPWLTAAEVAQRLSKELEEVKALHDEMYHIAVELEQERDFYYRKLLRLEKMCWAHLNQLRLAKRLGAYA